MIQERTHKLFNLKKSDKYNLKHIQSMSNDLSADENLKKFKSHKSYNTANSKNHKTIRDKYIKNRGSENNEVKEKAENQVILLTKQIEKLEKDLKAKDDEKNKILKEKNTLKQRKI